jgi:hypothetical protein
VFRSLSPYLLPTLLAPCSRVRSLCALLIERLSAVLSAAGAMCGIGGTALLAAHPDQTTAVFALYSGSAAAWMVVGYLTQQRWLLASNVVYLMLALKGLMF